MKKYLICTLLSLQLIQPNLFAKTVVLRDQKATTVSYSAYVKNSPEKINFIKYLIASAEASVDQDDFISHFESAQLAFFSGHSVKAKNHYQKILTFKSMFYLPKVMQEVISDSLLKLSELEASHYKKLYWVEQAYLYNPHFKLLPQQWSNKTKNLWLHVAKSSQWLSLPMAAIPKGFEAVKINHKIFYTAERELIRWPMHQQINIELLSNAFKTKTLQLSHPLKMQSLAHFKPSPLVIGSCRNFKLNPNSKDSNELIDFEVFFNSSCIAENKTSETEVDLKYLMPVDINNKHASSIESINAPVSNKPTPHLLENPWVWAGVGLIGLFIYNGQQKKASGVTPTETIGF